MVEVMNGSFWMAATYCRGKAVRLDLLISISESLGWKRQYTREKEHQATGGRGIYLIPLVASVLLLGEFFAHSKPLFCFFANVLLIQSSLFCFLPQTFCILKFQQ